MIGSLLREERGMALGLAIIVVVIVGVMGAGLLTFVSTDLQANRGEQAFELAEAGIEVAKAHLASDSNQANWSSGELHRAGVAESSVTFTIEDDAASGSFEVVSTGQYRETRRKIEATFSVEEGTPKLLSWRELYE